MKIKVNLCSPIYQLKHHVSVSRDKMLHEIEKKQQEELKMLCNTVLKTIVKATRQFHLSYFQPLKIPAQ